MERDDLLYWLTIFSSACWLVCFWWMYRISSAQNTLLSSLKKQSARIERLSQEEHDLIQDVHPQIEQIADKVGDLANGRR